MFDVVIAVGLLALMGFCGGAKDGLWAGLKNMAMFLLAVAAYFGMVAAAILAIRFYLMEMGGLETILDT